MRYETVDNLTIVGEHDKQTVQQMQNCLRVDGSRGVIMPDGHLGYSQPVGGVAAYPDHVSVSGVGYDIGCGNKAVKTSLLYQDVRTDLPRIMDDVTRRISFGMGVPASEQVDHSVLDEIAHAELHHQQAMIGTARAQLGTVGSGNHYVDLFRDETDRVWVGVHFGSRGFGHKTASGFLNLAAGRGFTDHVKGESMMADPVLLDVRSSLGHMYVEAMQLAGRYAYAGRDVVCDKVLEILGAEPMEEVHNHHNFAWEENHGGQTYWVARKGATPAWPGQLGFVGATMGEDSVILVGSDVDEVESETDQERTLFSTVHGAGRAMSRSEAAGKVRRRKRWGCPDRDCDFVSTRSPESGGPVRCPHHALELRRFYVEDVVKEGRIDFSKVRRSIAAKGIELRGAAADEAPAAYKRLDTVLEHCGATVQVLHTLTPVGVAMAGRDVRDDYKD